MNTSNQIVPARRTPLPVMAAVEALDELNVKITWQLGKRAGRTERVDLAPLINSLKYYRALRSDRALFETVHLNGNGTELLWGPTDDEIDMGAKSVERLAEDMMTADDFGTFLTRVHYTHAVAAAQLGYSRRQIENYLSGSTAVPRVCVLACHTLEQRYHALKDIDVTVFLGTSAARAISQSATAVVGHGSTTHEWFGIISLHSPVELEIHDSCLHDAAIRAACLPISTHRHSLFRGLNHSNVGTAYITADERAQVGYASE